MAERKYLFGDGDLAARRLELLARVFEESTRTFLLRAAGWGERPFAVDLGCGLGLTTRLIGETLQCEHVTGLDRSENFIKLARLTASQGVSFEIHDITDVPFPCGQADLIFCRFLLTHLENPEAIVARWATQLHPGGVLIIEEVETIRTSHSVFARYLQIVEEMLAGQANCLYAGRLAGTMHAPGGLQPHFNETRVVPVRSTDAAAMFVLNMNALKDTAFHRSIDAAGCTGAGKHRSPGAGVFCGLDTRPGLPASSRAPLFPCEMR
jgi:trans-aconitate 2-methyltransferase